MRRPRSPGSTRDRERLRPPARGGAVARPLSLRIGTFPPMAGATTRSPRTPCSVGDRADARLVQSGRARRRYLRLLPDARPGAPRPPTPLNARRPAPGVITSSLLAGDLRPQDCPSWEKRKSRTASRLCRRTHGRLWVEGVLQLGPPPKQGRRQNPDNRGLPIASEYETGTYAGGRAGENLVSDRTAP